MNDKKLKGHMLWVTGVAVTLFSCSAPASFDPISYERIAPICYYNSKMAKDVMPIGAWAGPDSSLGLNTREQFHNAKEAGLNFLHAGLGDCIWGQNDADLAKKRENIYASLEYAEQEGLLFFPCDSGIYQIESTTETYRRQANYESYSSFGGLLARDEPAYLEFNDLAEELQSFYSYYSKEDALFYINMNPSYVPPIYLSGRTYETYINDYIDIVKPDVLSYDFYPEIDEFPKIRSDYFLNLDIAAVAAKNHAIPFWNFVLVSQHYDYRYVSEAEIKWQIGTSLAYGVKGIQYFCFMTPNTPDYLEHPGSIVNERGERTELFEPVRKANTFLALIDEYLMQSSLVSMLKDGDSPAVVYSSFLGKEDKKENWRDLSSFSCPEGGLCSVFAYEDKSIYVIASNTFEKEAHAHLDFNRGIDANLFRYDGSVEAVHSTNLNVALPAGEFALLVINN